MGSIIHLVTEQDDRPNKITCGAWAPDSHLTKNLLNVTCIDCLYFTIKRKQAGNPANQVHLLDKLRVGAECGSIIQSNNELTFEVYEVTCEKCVDAMVSWKLYDSLADFCKMQAEYNKTMKRNKQEATVGFAYEEESVEHTVPEEDPSIRDYREELGHIEKDADGKRQEINELLGLARRQLSIWEAKAGLARDTIARLNEVLGNDHRPATAEKKFR